MSRFYSQFILFICLQLTLACTLNAGVITHVATSNRADLENDFLSGSPAVIQIDDPLHGEQQGVPAEYVSEAVVRVRLVYGREDLTDVLGNYFKYKITYGFFAIGGSQLPENGSLTIEYGEEESVFEAVMEHLVYTNDTYEILILSICGDATGDGVYTEICLGGGVSDLGIPALDIRLEVEQETNKIYHLDYFTDIPQLFNNPTYIEGQRSEIDLAWSFKPGFESYELEYVYWDVESTDFPEVSDPDYEEKVFENAIRVETWNQHHTLDISYPEGSIYYRVRGIGFFIRNVGANYELKKYGQWSKIGNSQIGGAGILQPFEENKNWQFSKSFAEEGKSKKVMSFYDGSLRSRQVLTNLNDDEVTLVAETDYSVEGQGIISILPTPIGLEGGFNHNNLFFKEGLNQNQAGNPYSYFDFDKQGGADPLNSNAGAGKYFSPNNSSSGMYKDYIADAGNFPLTQSKYRRDQTGRMISQGGVGDVYQLGTGHEVKYYYLPALSTELRRLFGSNVGHASHYKKNLIVDPNGQVSASYLDQQGRVIATSLIGVSPENVQELEGSEIMPVVKDLMESNTKNGLISRSHNTLFNPVSNTEFAFTYQLDGVFLNELGDALAGACVTCEYELEITIKDEDGLVVPLNIANPQIHLFPLGGISTYDCSNGGLYEESPITFSVNLPNVGTYEVIKELRVIGEGIDVSGLQELLIDYLPNLEDYIQSYIDEIDFDVCGWGCDPYCYNYVKENNPTWFNEDGELLEGFENLFNTVFTECVQYECLAALEEEEGENPLDQAAASECEGFLELMKTQVSPGGFGYGAPYNAFYTNDVTSEADVISELQNLLFTVIDQNGIPWTVEDDEAIDPFINTPDGPLVVLHADGVTTATISDWQSFLDVLFDEGYWQDQWADDLVKIHREYCLYQQCLELNTTPVPEDESSFEFDLRLSLAFTPMETQLVGMPAGEVGTNHLTVLISHDPLFADPSVSTRIGNCGAVAPEVELTANLLHFTPDPAGGDLSIFEIIDLYIADVTSPGEPYESATQETLERLRWQIFRGAYLNEKEKLSYNCTSCYVVDTNEDFFAEAVFKYSENSDIIDGNGQVDNDVVDDWYDENAAPFCEAMCEGQAAIWLQQINQYLEENCGTTIDPASTDGMNILAQFASFCTGDCGTGMNVIVEITEDNLDDLLTLVQNDLDSYLGDCPPGTVVEDLFDYVISTEVNTVTNGWDVINECFFTMVNAINQNLLTNCTFGNIYYANTPEEQDCFVSVSNYIVQSNGIDDIRIEGFPYSCLDPGGEPAPQPFMLWYFFDENGTHIDVCGSGMTEISEAYIDNLPMDFDPSGVDVGIYSGIALTIEFDSNQPSQKVYLFINEKFDCNLLVDYYITTQDLIEDCEAELIAQATEQATEVWQEDVDKILGDYYNALGNCIDLVQEEFHVAYEDIEHHFTLYYYDQGGNLVQTVPPIGVDVLDTGAGSPHFDDGVWLGYTEPGHEPNHEQKSIYKYTSLQQVREQETPDGGISTFEYNYATQLRLSQNAKQAVNNEYSYTRYDKQARIEEVGQIEGYTYTGIDDLNDIDFPYENTAPYTLTQQTKTTYDEAPGGSGLIQENLRSRVAYTENDHITTRYSYDIHGNVKSLQHSINALDGHLAQIDYTYDLISGNVQEVAYNEGELDEFFHRYEYDADNRLTFVHTSYDGVIWERDARYFYYQHGPLARVEVGHDNVQGMDYYYTLQGWIKGVNMPGAQSHEYEPGQDGYSTVINQHVGRDEGGYSLGYNNQDYTPINDNLNFGAAGVGNWDKFDQNLLPLSSSSGVDRGLYNGNIAWMTTDLPTFDQTPNDKMGLQAMVYQYDQLHRIRQARSYGVEGVLSNGDVTWIDNDHYNTTFTYDGNGNLQSLDRLAPGGEMDKLQYAYFNDFPNRLHYIAETAAQNSSYPQSVQGSDFGNYAYDEIGNLKQDLASDVQNINWNVYGKIDNIFSPNVGPISYSYDASGDRLTKFSNFATQFVYVRDASGNIMSIYEKDYTVENAQFIQKEIPLYGSSRIGQITINRSIEITADEGGSPRFFRNRGDKVFEISNHLGNVLAVVGDQKIGISLTSGGSQVDHYRGQVKSANDYYPFGMQMPNRTFSSPDYRYGFNGKEKDESGEFGNLTHYDYGFRIYNPGIGRFLSVDPLTASYPWYTPYQFAGNKVVQAIDLDGLEEKIVIGGEEVESNVSEENVPTATPSLIDDEISRDATAFNFVAPAAITNAQRSQDANKYWRYNYGNYTTYWTNNEIYEDAYYRNDKLNKQLLKGEFGERYAIDNMQFGVLEAQGNFNDKFGLILSFTPLGEGIGLLGGRYFSLLKSAYNSRRYITLYRGTDRIAELDAFAYDDWILSDAAIAGYREGGYSINAGLEASSKAQTSVLNKFGSFSNYAKKHSKYTSFESVYGIKRPAISLTSDLETAIYYSNGGSVFKFRVPRSSVYKVRKGGESEYLLLHGAKATKIK